MEVTAKPATLGRFAVYLGIAIAATIPAIVLRVEGWRPNPLFDAAFSGSLSLRRASCSPGARRPPKSG